MSSTASVPVIKRYEAFWPWTATTIYIETDEEVRTDVIGKCCGRFIIRRCVRTMGQQCLGAKCSESAFNSLRESKAQIRVNARSGMQHDHFVGDAGAKCAQSNVIAK
jgi:hypothetical protein